MLLLSDVEGGKQGFQDHMDLSHYIGGSLRVWKMNLFFVKLKYYLTVQSA